MATLFIRYFIPGKQQQFVNNTRTVCKQYEKCSVMTTAQSTKFTYEQNDLSYRCLPKMFIYKTNYIHISTPKINLLFIRHIKTEDM